MIYGFIRLQLLQIILKAWMLSKEDTTMKKNMIFIIAMLISMFAASSAFAESNASDINIAALIQNNDSMEDALKTLMEDGDMTLQEAVQAILTAGGDSTATLTAALDINPSFELADNFNPNTQEASASGEDDGGNSHAEGAHTPDAGAGGGGGGGGAVSS
ncbi:MAG: hypothetical protein Q9M16_09685 [Mariprofundus sp.]|nr:hypothetical protein [Mariprofundus sp.]